MENVHVPGKEILPPPSAPSPQFRLSGSSWALLLLQSPTASNSLPSAPSKEVLINALHFAASQALIARRIMISFFLVVSKQIWRTACPRGADTPQPRCSRAQRRQQGAKFTLITALNWSLSGQSPARVLWADTHCRPVGDLCWRGALCQGSSSVSPGTSGTSGVPAAELPRGPLKWKLKRSVSPWE